MLKFYTQNFSIGHKIELKQQTPNRGGMTMKKRNEKSLRDRRREFISYVKNPSNLMQVGCIPISDACEIFAVNEQSVSTYLSMFSDEFKKEGFEVVKYRKYLIIIPVEKDIAKETVDIPDLFEFYKEASKGESGESVCESGTVSEDC